MGGIIVPLVAARLALKTGPQAMAPRRLRLGLDRAHGRGRGPARDHVRCLTLHLHIRTGRIIPRVLVLARRHSLDPHLVLVLPRWSQELYLRPQCQSRLPLQLLLHSLLLFLVGSVGLLLAPRWVELVFPLLGRLMLRLFRLLWVLLLWLGPGTRTQRLVPAPLSPVPLDLLGEWGHCFSRGPPQCHRCCPLLRTQQFLKRQVFSPMHPRFQRVERSKSLWLGLDWGLVCLSISG